MLIYLILGVCAVVFFAVIAVFGATGGFNSAMGADQAQRRPLGLQSGWTSGDVRDVRFQLAFRGYRTDAVDMVLEQMTRRLAEQEAELGRLRAASDQRGAGRSEGGHRLGDGYPSTPEDSANAAEDSEPQTGKTRA
ncbi:DivIVA domain-containing protein [Brevibacterium otitidis]|uniref:DivIVA domain-containing protein n=1 Tax=Brevibacterium otitidis TaxID=53364 RepID=A0ABV5X4E9_9MICO|nr:hypothetical protein GCM10023233_16170 [Brevibacterium otitidis]